MAPSVKFQVCGQRAWELGVNPEAKGQAVDRTTAAGLAADARFHQDPGTGRYGKPLVEVEVDVPEEQALITTT
jgi:hypothetical protein